MTYTCMCGNPRPAREIPFCVACAAKAELYEAEINYELSLAHETGDPCARCEGTGSVSTRTEYRVADDRGLAHKLSVRECPACGGSKKAGRVG